MLEIGLVLGAYLTLVVLVGWQWLRQPPSVGYFLCGGLGLINLGLIMTSRDWLPHDQVSLLAAAVYIASLVFQGAVLFLVGGQLHRGFKAHLERVRLGPQAGPPPADLSPGTKMIVLLAAGAGAIVVVDLILSRRVFFLRPGEMWTFYVMLGGITVLLSLGCLRYYVERKKVRH